MDTSRSWTLNKAIVLLLISGFIMLFLEVRYEHRDVLSHEGASWIPVAFSLGALAIGALGLALWNSHGRTLLGVVFAASMLVGLMGTWLHADGDPSAVIRILSPSSGPVSAVAIHLAADGDEGTDRYETPPLESAPAPKDGGGRPPLAPLAFMGLGAIGLVATSRRFTAG